MLAETRFKKVSGPIMRLSYLAGNIQRLHFLASFSQESGAGGAHVAQCLRTTSTIHSGIPSKCVVTRVTSDQDSIELSHGHTVAMPFQQPIAAHRRSNQHSPHGAGSLRHGRWQSSTCDAPASEHVRCTDNRSRPEAVPHQAYRYVGLDFIEKICQIVAL